MMRSHLFALTMLLASLNLASAQDKKEEKPVLPKPKSPVVIVEKEEQMVTIYLHYFFPNYCHGYYTGYTMTVPCQVPVSTAKYYYQSGAASAPQGFDHGTPAMAPQAPEEPWQILLRR